MNAKLTKKRLGYYVLFSFLLVWVPTIFFLLSGGSYESGAMNFILTYSMLCPTFAVLLTRFLTQEGYGADGRGFLVLGMDFSHGKWKWYVFAILIPIIYMDLGAAIFYAVFPKAFNPEMLEVYGVTETTIWMYPIAGITSTVMVSIGALGEEIGWRGYMMPKLEEVFGLKKALLIGGVIWGSWHYPAICAGHNFGTGYWGEPWSGFLVFTIFTIFVGAVLTLVTKQTNSVWPAAFLHAVNNSGANMLSAYLDKSKLSGVAAEPTVIMLIRMVPVILLGIWAFMKMSKKRN